MKQLLPIYLTVFVTGAAVLIIEIAATRLLPPYFGATLFTLSSLIAVILGALSLGYWWGGKLADRSPSPITLHATVFVAGVATLITLLTKSLILSAASTLLDIQSGPLVASLLLFFTPSLFLGMASPIATRIATKAVKTSGQVVGKIFFVGTVGSIAGSLLTGFVLIPHLPLSQILIGTSLTLVAIGATGMLSGGQPKLILTVATIAAFAVTVTTEPAPQANLLYAEDSPYQHIRVVNDFLDNKPATVLLLDRAYSAASYSNSDELPFPYTRYYQLYELVNPKARRFLFLGGGGFTIPRRLLQERQDDIRVEVVEIDPVLPEIARRFFKLKDDPRLTITIADARSYLAKTRNQFDLIFIDVFAADLSVPPHLVTEEFFRLVKDHLAAEGMVVMNVVANLEERKPSLGLSAITTFRAVFPQSAFVALHPESLSRVQNLLVVGLGNPKADIHTLITRATNSKAEELKTLPSHLIDLAQFDISKQVVFSDDYAPTEYLTATMLSNREP